MWKVFSANQDGALLLSEVARVQPHKDSELQLTDVQD